MKAVIQFSYNKFVKKKENSPGHMQQYSTATYTLVDLSMCSVIPPVHRFIKT